MPVTSVSIFGVSASLSKGKTASEKPGIRPKSVIHTLSGSSKLLLKIITMHHQVDTLLAKQRASTCRWSALESHLSTKYRYAFLVDRERILTSF